MVTWFHVLLVTLAYLLGSVSSAVWIGKIFYDLDIREYGSGNAGATNVFRIIGKTAGVSVLVIDLLKGFVAVKLAYLVNDFLPGTDQFINLELSLGVAAVVGHIVPVFSGFRGGKGVSTLLGVAAAIQPLAALACAGIFILLLLVTHYVSFSSMISGLSFPVMIILVFQNTIQSLHIFSLTIAILLLITHQKNIERLIRGEESKAYLFKRRK